jgi:hypothetical protein
MHIDKDTLANIEQLDREQLIELALQLQEEVARKEVEGERLRTALALWDRVQEFYRQQRKELHQRYGIPRLKRQ